MDDFHYYILAFNHKAKARMARRKMMYLMLARSIGKGCMGMSFRNGYILLTD